nr:hypothetical protein [Tanacetum cinerariifolium]
AEDDTNHHGKRERAQRFAAEDVEHQHYQEHRGERNHGAREGRVQGWVHHLGEGQLGVVA